MFFKLINIIEINVFVHNSSPNLGPLPRPHWTTTSLAMFYLRHHYDYLRSSLFLLPDWPLWCLFRYDLLTKLYIISWLFIMTYLCIALALIIIDRQSLRSSPLLAPWLTTYGVYSGMICLQNLYTISWLFMITYLCIDMPARCTPFKNACNLTFSVNI